MVRGGSVNVTRCDFKGNWAEVGGAIAVDAAVGDLLAMTITHSQFLSNNASRGGCMQFMSTGSIAPSIANSLFDGCTATTVGGGLNVEGSGTFGLVETNFTDCRADGMGAAVNYDPRAVGQTPYFRGCDFVRNAGLSTTSASAI